jgi:hypothetical protein
MIDYFQLAVLEVALDLRTECPLRGTPGIHFIGAYVALNCRHVTTI